MAEGRSGPQGGTTSVAKTEAFHNEPARRASRAMVCTVDHLASGAALRAFQQGGNAVDAAIAASSALAVTTQHMCGMGGDLWALIQQNGSPPVALNASGRSGSGSDPDQLRAEGLNTMPFRNDIRTVPVPGCVDGWMALHERFGSLGRAEILAPAITLAESGFPATDMLAAASNLVQGVAGGDDYSPGGSPLRPGQIVRRPGLARSLRAIAESGRAGWYEGEFGEGLITVGDGVFSTQDLATTNAEWVTPLRRDAWGNTLWTVPANSQGYLSLLGANIAEHVGLENDPADPQWAHILVEASKQAAADRHSQLFDGADLQPLLSGDEARARASLINPEAAGSLSAPVAGGGTIYLCTADENMSVSLMNSNAAGFGSHLAVPGVGVFLHNRGIGFSLQSGHPAELKPGVRPPSTLSPALISGPDGQPQVVLQMAARLLGAAQDPGTVVSAPRFTLTVPDALGFDTWAKADSISVAVESGTSWDAGLSARGHDVLVRPIGQSLFGHAHVIDTSNGTLSGAAEPRTGSSAAIGM